MNRLEALEELAAKVVAGEPGDWGFEALGAEDQEADAADAFHGSLDAALALHEAVLSGWRIEEIHQKYSREGMGPFYVSLERKNDLANVLAMSASPARAWLIAILRALIAIEGGGRK